MKRRNLYKEVFGWSFSSEMQVEQLVPSLCTTMFPHTEPPIPSHWCFWDQSFGCSHPTRLTWPLVVSGSSQNKSHVNVSQVNRELPSILKNGSRDCKSALRSVEKWKINKVSKEKKTLTLNTLWCVLLLWATVLYKTHNSKLSQLHWRGNLIIKTHLLLLLHTFRLLVLLACTLTQLLCVTPFLTLSHTNSPPPSLVFIGSL